MVGRKAKLNEGNVSIPDGSPSVEPCDTSRRFLSVPTTGEMPFQDGEARRAYAKKYFEEKGSAQIQRSRLFRRLWKGFEKNEEQRENNMTVRGLEPVPKAETLRKYGIEVYLSDPSMFHDDKETNKNYFIQVRYPRLIEPWTPEPEVTMLPESTSSLNYFDVETGLAELEKKLSEGVFKNNKGQDMKEKTLKTIGSRFRQNVESSGCDNILAWVNNGKLLKFIQGKYPVRNTLKAHLYSLWFIIVERDLLPNVLERSKEAIHKAFNEASEIVRVHQVLSTLDERNKSKPFDQILAEASHDFDELSDEMVLLRVYDEVPLRDDFPDVVVYRHLPQVFTERNENYYIVPTGTIHFSYRNKTNQLEEFDHEFKEETKSLLRDYTEAHGGNKLFPRKPIHILRDIGLSINKLRHAKVTELYKDPNLTDEQRTDLAYRMNNSVFTQIVAYPRKPL